MLCFVVTILCSLEYLQSLCFPGQNYKCLMFAVLYNSTPLRSQGTQSILEEESHIKDVLSRIVVEMIKREWPQHWPDMLKELDTLSKQGVWNTPVSPLLLAHGMHFSLPSSWGKPQMVKWGRLMMHLKISASLSYSRRWFQQKEGHPPVLFPWDVTCIFMRAHCLSTSLRWILGISIFELCWWSVFHFGTPGNSNRTGDVHPPTFGRGCGDFSNSAYPAATRYTANPHPEHGEDLQFPTNYPAAECQQVQTHGKSLLSLGSVSAGGL